MKSIALNMTYRGDRTYLHGTDIVPTVLATARDVAGAPADGPLSFSFKSFSDNQLDMVVFEDGDELARPENGMVYFDVTTAAGPVRGWLVRSARPVEERRPFDESKISDHVSIKGDSAHIAASTGLAPIEVVVPMTKHLHQSRWPAPNERWILSRLDLERPLRPDDVDTLTIEVIKNLKQRLTRSTLTTPAGTLGEIYFSRIPK